MEDSISDKSIPDTQKTYFHYIIWPITFAFLFSEFI